MLTRDSMREGCYVEAACRREIILDCTTTIATSGGYDAVKMRAVADNAGIAVGTLYRYFPSKPHVLVAVLTREFERIGAERDWTASAGSPRLRVEQLTTRLCQEWWARPALTEAVTRAFVFADGNASAEVDRAATVVEHMIGMAIAGGDPTARQHRLAALVGDIWLANLVAWVRHGAKAEDVAAAGLERSIGLIVRDDD